MLPHHLYSSYERYKADTNYVAHWLATTAHKCGHVPSATKENLTAAAQRSTRLKGKARKLSRTTGQASTQEQARNRHTYRIQIEEFVPLAECIANNRTVKLERPDTFVYVLRCCIHERSRHLRHHSQSDGKGEEDDGHGYFVRILQQVQTVLQPVLPHPITRDRPGVPDDVTSASEDNMFANLTIDEPSQPGEYMQSPQETIPPEGPKFIIDLSAREDEVQIATAMLFNDLHRIRDVVQDIWRLYLKGGMDLMAASIVTNTAIDFVRSIQLDFVGMFSGRVDLNKEPCYTCAYMIDHNLDASTLHRPCMVSAHWIFSIFKKVYLDDTSEFVPIVALCNLGLFDPLDSSDKSVSLRQYTLRDLKLAMGVIPEFCVLLKTNSSVLAEHELSRGLRQVMNEKKEIFWVTFAIQLFLDMRNILKTDVGMGFEHMIQQGRLIIHNIKDVIQLHNTQLSKLAFQERPLRELVELIERYTESDYVGLCRKELENDPSSSAHLEEYHLLKRDPIWCGLLLYNFRMYSYELSIILSNSFFTIQATAHLYNYLMQAGLLQQKWTDMEYVLKAHEKNETFVGNRPCTAVDCAKQFLLACGVSATELAQNRRPTDRFSASRKNAKTLKYRAPLAASFKGRFCLNDGRTNLEPKEMDKIIQNVWKLNTKGKTKRDVCTTIKLLALALHEEVQELFFGYFLCWGVLSRLVHTLAERNLELRALSSSPAHYPESVGLLLTEAAEFESLPVHSDDMCAVAAIVGQAVLAEGRVAFANVTAVSIATLLDTRFRRAA